MPKKLSVNFKNITKNVIHIAITITARKNNDPDFHSYLKWYALLKSKHVKPFLFESISSIDMVQVRDIMQKNVITIEHNKTALEAAQLISKKGISFLVIVKDGKPIGVVTEKDFLLKITSEDKQASKIPLKDIMSYKFRWVEPSTDIEDAVQKMLNNNIRRLLVLENENLVGVITQTDLVGFLRSRLLIEGTVENILPDES